MVAVREVHDDEVATQFGSRADFGAEEPDFRCRPRAHIRESGLSVILGTLTVAEVVTLVRPRGGLRNGDGRRCTTVGKLRAAGFVVTHTPSPRNPDHATVSVPLVWQAYQDEAFNMCFDDPVWHGEEVTADE